MVPGMAGHSVLAKRWEIVGADVVGRVQLAEVGLKPFVYRNAFFSSDAMNVLDLIVVAIDLVGMIGSHVGSNILSFTVLRTLRLIRVARILRGFAELRKLYVMLRGLVSAFRAIAFVTGLIFSMLLM